MKGRVDKVEGPGEISGIVSEFENIDIFCFQEL
jgi:hypothetical protein